MVNMNTDNINIYWSKKVLKEVLAFNYFILSNIWLSRKSLFFMLYGMQAGICHHSFITTWMKCVILTNFSSGSKFNYISSCSVYDGYFLHEPPVFRFLLFIHFEELG